MAISSADIHIINSALIMIGDSPISDISEDSDRALAAKTLYEDTRDAVLFDHPWNFALKRKTLARLENPPVWPSGMFFYQLESDTIRVWKVEDEIRQTWQIEGDRLITAAEAVNVLYIARITDPTRWSSGFKDAFKAKLAAELSIPLTSKRGTTRDLQELYFQKLKDARSLDGMEGMPEIDDFNTLAEVRNARIFGPMRDQSGFAIFG